MKLVIAGGGFAGLAAALNAAGEIETARADISVTLVSKDPYLTIRPRLYEAAPETLRAPLAPALDATGAAFVEGSAVGVDTAAKALAIETAAGRRNLAYDRLILATGSEMKPFPIPGAAQFAHDVDTWDGAVALDRHLAEVLRTPGAKGHLAVVIVGAGMCGIELACEMRARIAVHASDEVAQRARVVLLDRADVVGPDLGPGPRPAVLDALKHARVEIRLGVSAGAIERDAVYLTDGRRIDAATTVVAVGMRASPLSESIAASRDDVGRLVVDEMLRVPGADGIFATGDVAHAEAEPGHPAMMSCQHARTMGKFAGGNAVRDLLGRPLVPYRQTGYTTCLDLGAAGAVFTTGWERETKATGAEAKKRKTWINRELIYPPPVGCTREDAIAFGRIDPVTGR